MVILATYHQYPWPEWLGKLLGKIREGRGSQQSWELSRQQLRTIYIVVYGGNYRFGQFPLRGCCSPKKSVLCCDILNVYVLCSVEVLAPSRSLRRDSGMC